MGYGQAAMGISEAIGSVDRMMQQYDDEADRIQEPAATSPEEEAHAGVKAEINAASPEVIARVEIAAGVVAPPLPCVRAPARGVFSRPKGRSDDQGAWQPPNGRRHACRVVIGDPVVPGDGQQPMAGRRSRPAADGRGSG